MMKNTLKINRKSLKLTTLGFTLIELLAVIVILAIIALIATPIVLNIIKDSKESSGLQSANFYLDAVQNSVAKEMLDGTKVEDGIYKIMEDGNLCLKLNDDKTCKRGLLRVEVNGQIPIKGMIKIEKGKIKDPEIILNDRVIAEDNNKLIYSEPLFDELVTFTYSEDTKTYTSSVCFDTIKLNNNTEYKITLSDTQKNNFVFEDLILYQINQNNQKIVSLISNDGLNGLIIASEQCVFMLNEELDTLEKYNVKIEKEYEEVITYSGVINKETNYSAINNLTIHSIDLKSETFVELLIKDEDGNIIYVNENIEIGFVTGGWVKEIQFYDDSAINSIFSALENNKKIIMLITSKDDENIVDEIKIHPDDAICQGKNSSNECISYFIGNDKMLISS